MNDSFTFRGGRWCFRAKITTHKGTEFASPYALWETKEDAERDFDLFVWYKSRKSPDAPSIPPPRGEWFKSLLPDESWNAIREHLSKHGQAKPPKKRKRTASIEVKRRKQTIALVAPSVELEKSVEVSIETTLTNNDMLRKLIGGSVMRKPYSTLCDRRQSAVDASVMGVIRLCWDYLAPKQPYEELVKCIDSVFTISDMNTAMRESIQLAYKLAGQRNNREHKIQILSTFMLQKDITKSKLELMMGEDISARKYQHAKHHAFCYPT